MYVDAQIPLKNTFLLRRGTFPFSEKTRPEELCIQNFFSSILEP